MGVSVALRLRGGDRFADFMAADQRDLEQPKAANDVRRLSLSMVERLGLNGHGLVN